MNARIIAGAAALILAAQAQAVCEPIVTAGVAYADYYMSAQVEPDAVPERFGGPLARLKLGARCSGVRVYLEHTSSIDSTRDAGINLLAVEFDILSIVGGTP
jgi:hypothetical protein